MQRSNLRDDCRQKLVHYALEKNKFFKKIEVASLLFVKCNLGKHTRYFIHGIVSSAL